MSVDNFYSLLTGGTDNGYFSRKVYVNGKTTTAEGGDPADYATLVQFLFFLSFSSTLAFPILIFIAMGRTPANIFNGFTF